MDSLVIHGAGPLHGEVTVSGAKNAALPLLAATLLAPGEHLLRNVPELTDVRTLLRLLTGMGCETRRGRGAQRTTLRITVPKAVSPEAPYELVKTMRASVLVLGPLLARHGSARVSLPGGCAIGARPIDQHLKALTALGAQIELVDGYVHASTKGLKGTTVTFDMITVTGTENIMMAAALAKGRTVIKNAAREPEIENLAQALNRMGAQVSGAGTAVITIDGVSSLAPAEQEIFPTASKREPCSSPPPSPAARRWCERQIPPTWSRCSINFGKLGQASVSNQTVSPCVAPSVQRRWKSQPKSIRAFRQTCRRSSWRC